MTSKSIQLSADTLQILKVMSTINPSMAFTEGNELKTISASGAIVMEAEIAETLPVSFKVYELNRLLSILNLANFKEAELVFEDDQPYMTIQQGKSKVKYFFSSEKIIEHPGKKIVLPKIDITLSLAKSEIDDFQKAASVLGHKFMQFKVEDKQLFLIATGEEVDSSNDYVLELGEVDADDYDAKIKLDNLKLIPGDYTVGLLKLPNKGITRWENLTRKIVSYIGLETK